MAEQNTSTSSGFTHVIKQTGEVLEIPSSQLGAARNKGWTEATPEQASQFSAQDEKIKKYGGTGQQVIAGIEGVASGLTLGGSEYLEKWSGITDEEGLAARAEL